MAVCRTGSLGCAVLVAVSLVASGCTVPWRDARRDPQPTQAAPSPSEAPKVGSCYLSTSTNVYEYPNQLLTAIGCENLHTIELIAIGQFTGAVAAAKEPPRNEPPVSTEVFAACRKAADKLLGGDMHTARVEAFYSAPSRREWDLGGRSYQCYLAAVAGEQGNLAPVPTSFKDGLTGARPLAIGCANVDGAITQVVYVACAERHTTEFVGAFVPPGDTFPGEAQLETLAKDGCGTRARTYLGRAATAALPRGLGGFYWGSVDEQNWDSGQRRIRCYVTVADTGKPIRAGATVKDLGGKALPVAA